MKEEEKYLKQVALICLSRLHQKQKLYKSVNKKILEVSDNEIKMIDDEIMDNYVDILDAILGDNIASYFLWDKPEKGGHITIGKDRYNIKTIKDVKKFVFRSVK